MRVFVFSLFLSSSASSQIQIGDFLTDFESANITNIQRIGADSFTFAIDLDPYPGDTYGWYYFAIANNSGRAATLFLTNPDNWQNESCAPVMSLDGGVWFRVGAVWRHGSWVGFRQRLAADTVWFAQGFPFTVSRMYAYLDTLEFLPDVSRRTLGYSVHSRPIDAVRITDNIWPDSKKKAAWLISRQHPMESPPTYLLYGLMEYVTSDMEFARRFRRDIDLHIVPIVNVDGVAEGLSRQNVHGININRDWGPNFADEEPEVRAVHQAIDSTIAAGNDIDLFMDLHASPDNYDFGFRMSLSYTDSAYFRSQGTFLHLLETFDYYQEDSRWRDLDTNYAFGVSCVALYDMYEMDALSSEIPWTYRDDGSFIDIGTLIDQGPDWAHAIYNYLYPLTAYAIGDSIIDYISAGNSFTPKVWDYDRRSLNSVSITAVCVESADSEMVMLQRQNSDGLFASANPVPTNALPGVPGDGVVSLVEGGELVLIYIDPTLPSRAFQRYLPVGEPCRYLTGDVNNSGITNGIDVVYYVRYLRGGAMPPVSCPCAAHGTLLVAADVNGDCAANGLDVVYLVNYFKGGSSPQYCADCPPEDWR
jgi:hypothetical protein